MKATVAELAWLAGFIDGEGTIGISRCNGKSWPHPYLRPHLQIPNTDRRLIDFAASIFEKITGKAPHITVCNKGCDRWKKAWRIKVGTQWELVMVLPALEPYLISKKRQAHLTFDFCARKSSRYRGNGGPRWYEFAEMDLAAYHECLALNKRGVVQEQADRASVIPMTKEA